MLSRFIVTLFALLLFTPSAARADVSVWQDTETALTFSYPDTWKIVTNIAPDDIVTIAAPSGRTHAQCRIKARDDGRFKIYPPVHYAAEIRDTAHGHSFWKSYVDEVHENGALHFFEGHAGFGQAFGSYAVAEYQGTVPGDLMQRRALMFAALYDGQSYILECSSRTGAFEGWYNTFVGIMRSVGFRTIHRQPFHGAYRNFMADEPFMYRAGPGHKGAILY